MSCPFALTDSTFIGALKIGPVRTCPSRKGSRRFTGSNQPGHTSVTSAIYRGPKGWLTGWNLTQLDSSRPTVNLNAPQHPIEGMKSFIREYCGNHPAVLYMEAVYRYYFSLKGSP